VENQVVEDMAPEPVVVAPVPHSEPLTGKAVSFTVMDEVGTLVDSAPLANHVEQVKSSGIGRLGRKGGPK
jgi:hypothetical protein